MVVKANCFGGDHTAHVVLILQQLNKTLSKNTFLKKLDDVTNNDVLGFDSRLLFLSAHIIAPILTKKIIMSQLKHKVSFQIGNYLRSPLYIRERVARMTRVTIDL